MDQVALSPDQIIAEFQRRRRLTFKIRNWTAGFGFGGVFWGVLLKDAGWKPFWIISPFVLSMVIAVFGALYVRHLYRCPRCALLVQVPDTIDYGYVFLKDPAWCPHCGVILK